MIPPTTTMTPTTSARRETPSALPARAGIAALDVELPLLPPLEPDFFLATRFDRLTSALRAAAECSRVANAASG